MKLKYRTTIRHLSKAIKIYLLVMALLIGSSSSGVAQGVVHLDQGGSYLFSQPTLLLFKIYEAFTPFVVMDIDFSEGSFTAGESFQVDILSTPTSLTPLLTGTFSYPFGTHNQWNGVVWNAGSGAIRLTMLSGNMDVSSLAVRTGENFTELDYSYTIPEPSVSLLLAPGLLYVFLRQRRFLPNKRV